MSDKEKLEKLSRLAYRLAWDIKETTDDLNLINQADDILLLIKK
jgi:hypothetical protein